MTEPAVITTCTELLPAVTVTGVDHCKAPATDWVIVIARPPVGAFPVRVIVNVTWLFVNTLVTPPGNAASDTRADLTSN